MDPLGVCPTLSRRHSEVKKAYNKLNQNKFNYLYETLKKSGYDPINWIGESSYSPDSSHRICDWIFCQAWSLKNFKVTDELID